MAAGQIPADQLSGQWLLEQVSLTNLENFLPHRQVMLGIVNRFSDHGLRLQEHLAVEFLFDEEAEEEREIYTNLTRFFTVYSAQQRDKMLEKLRAVDGVQLFRNLSILADRLHRYDPDTFVDPNPSSGSEYTSLGM